MKFSYMSGVTCRHTVAVCLCMKIYFSDTLGNTSKRHLAVIAALTVLLLLKHAFKCLHILQTPWDCVVEKAESRIIGLWSTGKLQDLENLSDRPVLKSVIMPPLQGERNVNIISGIVEFFLTSINSLAVKKKLAAGLLTQTCCHFIFESWSVDPLQLDTEWADGFPLSLNFSFFIVAAQLQEMGCHQSVLSCCLRGNFSETVASEYLLQTNELLKVHSLFPLSSLWCSELLRGLLWNRWCHTVKFTMRIQITLKVCMRHILCLCHMQGGMIWLVVQKKNSLKSAGRFFCRIDVVKMLMM